MEPIDLLVTHIGQLATPPAAATALRGAAMARIELRNDAALAVHKGRVLAVGSHSDLEDAYRPTQVLDAGGACVTPGLVDPHTHAVWAGERRGEFERRIAGATYMEILAAGGGILATVAATRRADRDHIVAETLPRLQTMLAHGTTTAEVKTGYGLTLEDERKLLDAIAVLDAQHPMDLVPTFLGAHAVPPEFRDRPDAYVDLIVEEMLPELAYLVYTVTGEDGSAYRQRAVHFCDVFCERGVFDLEQTRRILTAAKSHGLDLKLHVDEFEPMGGVSLAIELGATSVDHLVRTGEEELARLAASNTVGVVLPGTPFGLGHNHFAPARRLIDLGGAVALATDLNPGTTWCESMPLMMALATRYMRLTPAEALTAATLNAAHAIGLGRFVGALAPGYQADFVVWDTDDYRDLTYRYGVNLVKKVYKRGREVVTGN
ncbi:MAG: imidazolonepropionase [Caldilineales bacterium]|nr:imidazolonepropionase [Caldilineales bacterium]